MVSTIALNKLKIAEAKYKHAQGKVLAMERKYTQKKLPSQKQTKKLANKVNELTKKVNAGTATHTHRRQASFYAFANPNQVGYSATNAFSTVTCEDAMALLRYYSPSAPGTLVTADGSTGAYNREFQFSKTSTSLQVANNYVTPCEVRIYYVTPKDDTSQLSTNTISAGFSDQMITSGYTSQLMYPTDSEQFRALWKIEKSWKRRLKPGQTFTATQGVKDFVYEPSNVDVHALTFQSKYGGGQWLIRLMGPLGHTTDNNNRLFLDATLDCLVKTTTRITYDAGTSLEDYSVSEILGSESTPGVVTNAPIADNQYYSIP